ncbi:hypothetical protein Tco_0313395 [Tanacetum coccineum]
MTSVVAAVDEVSLSESNTADPGVVIFVIFNLALASRIAARSRRSSSKSKFSRSSSSLCAASTAAVRYESDDEVEDVTVKQMPILKQRGPDIKNLIFINEADVKSVTAKETGLKPEEQRLVLRGKEMDNLEHFHMVDVKRVE